MRTPVSIGPARYLGGAVAAAVIVVVLYVFFVRSHAGQVVDQLAYEGADFGWRSVTPFTRRLLDSLPSISVAVGVVLTLVVGIVRRNWMTLAIAIGAAVVAAVSTQLLKYAVLSRPDLGVEGYAGNSFPSGHTTVAAASALAVFLVVSPRARPAAAATGTAFAVAAGVATLANQWHRPSDVIAALAAVAFWGCVAGAVLASVSGRRPRPGPPKGVAFRRAWWIVLPFVAVSAVAFLITLLGASVAPYVTLIAYIGGVTGIVAAGFVIAIIGTRLFARLP